MIGASHDAAVVVVIVAAAGAGVAPLLGLLRQLVVGVHRRRVLLAQPMALLPDKWQTFF